MKCSFCGGSVKEGRGKIFVRVSGQRLLFCSSKCQKNWKLGRVAKKVRWTETSRKLK